MNPYDENSRVPTARIVLMSFFLLFAYGLGEASWHNLEPGPYGVGFKTIEKYDLSRTYSPKYDYFGNPLEGERARPIQLCVWYPAQTAADDSRMVYGEYNYPYPGDDRFFNFVTRLQGQDNGYLFFSFQNDQGLVLDFLSVEMNAVKNAEPQAGQFPLIIYFPNLNSGFADNALLCEYLASHGFVIATSQNYGTRELAAQFTQGDLETQISDKEFIFANVQELPFADLNKTATLGNGFGGLASMLMAMRCSDVEAALSFNGPFINPDYIEFTNNCPYFARENLKVPFMQIYNGNIENADLSLVDSLRYSERFSVLLTDLPRPAFTSYPILSTSVPGQENAVSETGFSSYKLICQYAVNFFDAYLNGSETSKAFIYNTPGDNKIDPKMLEISVIKARAVPPTPAEFVGIVQNQGVPAAVELYEKFKIEEPQHVLFDENTLNRIGYGLLTGGDVDNALEIFRMNTEVYPASCNVWDSYADGLTAAGEEQRAAGCLRKAMEVMPADSTSSDALKEAIRAHVRQVLGEEEFQKYQQ